MTSSRRPASTLLCIVVAVGTSRHAVASEPRSYLVSGSSGPARPTYSSKCGDGSFVVGLTIPHTDRMVGLTVACAKAGPDGLWPEGHAFNPTIGNRGTPTEPRPICQPGSYVVGLNYSIGEYRAGGGIGPVPADTLADLQPVCRSFVGGDHTFFDRAQLQGAEDNNVRDVKWDGIGSPKSCPEGEAASAIDVWMDDSEGLRDLFTDVRLVCEPLWINRPNPKEEIFRGESPNYRSTVIVKGGLPALRPGAAGKGLKVFSPAGDAAHPRFGYCSVAGNAQTCGQDAARRFCLSQEYSNAEAFGRAEVVNGTSSLMFNNDDCVVDCKALSAVVCRK